VAKKPIAPKKKPAPKPKGEGFRWGFQWGKVVSGGLMLLIGLGIIGAFLLVGRLNFWGIGIAGLGLITMLLGVIGEEGVW
jgi:hypothetical protein